MWSCLPIRYHLSVPYINATCHLELIYGTKMDTECSIIVRIARNVVMQHLICWLPSRHDKGEIIRDAASLRGCITITPMAGLAYEMSLTIDDDNRAHPDDAIPTYAQGAITEWQCKRILLPQYRHALLVRSWLLTPD
jgi:hypothetical protein